MQNPWFRSEIKNLTRQQDVAYLRWKQYNIVEVIGQRLDKNCVTFLALLDHSKAFDSVNHIILCTKLWNSFNFSTNATKVISSYLTNRYQAVVSGMQVSTFPNLSRGVPQGSVLGP